MELSYRPSWDFSALIVGLCWLIESDKKWLRSLSFLNYFGLDLLLLLTEGLLLEVFGFETDLERLVLCDDIMLMYARFFLPFDLDRFLEVSLLGWLRLAIRETLGFLYHWSIVLDLSANCIGGFLNEPDSTWIECTCLRRLFLNLLLLLFVLRAELSRLKNWRTSCLSDVFSTLSFYVVFVSLFNIRVSILLRLLITFSYI